MKILVIGGEREIHNELMKLGVDVFYMTTTDKVRDSDFQKYRSVITLNPKADLNEWIEYSRIFHSINHFDKIVSFHEKTQVISSKICEALNLEKGKAELYQLVQNKNLLREFLILNKLDNSFCYVVKNDPLLIKECFLIEKIPLIAKPVDGFASIGVYRIDSVDDIENVSSRYAKETKNDFIYLEKLISGLEYSVEIFSEKGQHYLLAVTTKYNEKTRFIDLGHSLPTFEADEAIFLKVKKMLDLIGYSDGISHTEVIRTDSDVFITETHFRIAGDYIPQMIKNSFDINVYELIAKNVIGISVREQLSNLTFNGNFSAVWFKRPLINGIIKKVGINKSNQNFNQIDFGIYLNEGDLIKDNILTSSRICYSLNSGKNIRQAITNAQASTELIEVIIEPV